MSLLKTAPVVAGAALLLGAIAAIASTPPPAAANPTAGAGAASALHPAVSATSAAAKEQVAVVTTPYGEIAWRFFEKDAPGHVAYVKELIGRGFYDGTTFHRVIPHFVVQGGDPNSKNEDRLDDGEGEADRRLKAEFSTTLHYRPGTVGMARDADPDSGSCQFFIALENIPRLDGRYTIFGEVISGLDVARKIADLPRDLRDNPLERVAVKVRLESREVPAKIVSLEAGESGEVVTGPTKPKPFDPKNSLWKAPALKAPAAGSRAAQAASSKSEPASSGRSGVARAAAGAEHPETRPRAGGGAMLARIEIVVGADGSVLDARFPALETPGAAAIRAEALGWIFEPALYDGTPQKARLEIRTDGDQMGPPTGPGAPIDSTEAAAGPAAAPRVDLPAGRKAPEKAPRLRLTIDESGNVVEAALQSGCGDPSLDAAAVESAKKMTFTPAKRAFPGKKDPDPTPVYLDVEVRFVTPAP